ncbi:two-component sensor histidine kinase [Devosia nitrariae]|uniref:histidine kinase n=1 Tax=Devosia nitrariae TaxID=2071872 RepID=A0ABQ5W2R2_9HYPH|nr:HAMP domain-containing sensor histidine kinase [Devosia nitrariae]GLQ54101.1 two-component sensor histidine kinase [Devosia nitrariae]
MTLAPKIAPKWRPSLGLIVVSVLLSVLGLPVALVVWFRALEGPGRSLAPLEIGALAGAFALTLVIAYVLTRTITRPIDALVARAEAIGRGGRTAIRPLDRYGTRETALLAQSLLGLASRLVDRTEYVQSFAAHVSHELKSPLTSIKGAAELLLDAEEGQALNEEERRRFLDHIIADVDRLTALLDRLRELARADTPATGAPASLIAIADALEGRFTQLELRLSGATEPALALPIEAGQVVFGHLAENAARHGASRLEIGAQVSEGIATIVVADDGSGISPGNRNLVFQPFFTTRREEGGTGMGLEIVRTMLGAYGGSIRLLDTQTGAAFEVVVPLAAESRLV